MNEWTILVIGHENGLASGPSDPFSGHPQHYPRIEVVEKDAAMARIRELEAQELGFIQTLCVQSEEAKELRERIALLEAVAEAAETIVKKFSDLTFKQLSSKLRAAGYLKDA